MLYVGAFKMVNRSAVFFIRVERVEKQGYHVTLWTEAAEQRVAGKVIEYLNFLHCTD